MVKIKKKEHHTFISNLINNESTIVDLGGYKGEFSKFIKNNYDSKVYVIEAVPELYNNLKNIPNINPFNYCVTNSNKICKIKVPSKGCASNKVDKIKGTNVYVQGITLENFSKEQKIKTIDLIKMDIEGAEIEVLESISENILNNTKQITVEFHDFMWPDMNKKVENIKKNIIKSGFYCIPFSLTNNGDVLFVRKDLISKLDYYYLKFFKRYFMGIKRKIKQQK